MESITIFNSAPILMFVWGAAIVLILFRPYLSIVWKIVPLLLFCFYIWFFHHEFISMYTALKTSFAATMIAFLKDFLVISFYLLFVVWPIGLVIAFYSAEEMNAEFIIKFLVAITLCVWFAMTVYILFSNRLDSELIKKIFSMFPFRRT